MQGNGRVLLDDLDARSSGEIRFSPATKWKVEMKLRYSVDFQLTFKITMKEDIKEQYRIISWKNKIVVKRNPRELAMDILYSP